MKLNSIAILGSIISFIIFASACNDDTCPSDITNDIKLDVHYDKLFSCGSGGESFTRYFNSWDDYRYDPCYGQTFSVGLGFEGIVIAQGIKVPFISENENEGRAYELDVQLTLDNCDKTVDFNFILTNVDTFQRFEHNRNVIVLLNGIDSTYQVNFSHEVIPFE